MSRAGVAIGLGTAVALLVVTPASAATVCKPSGHTTVVSSSKGKVTKRTVRGVTTYYGCLYRVGQVFRLARAGTLAGGTSAVVRHVRLTSPFAALASGQTNEQGGGDESVIVHDLRTGRVRRRGPVLGECTGQCTTDLELTSRAGVAWIQHDPGGVVRGPGEAPTPARNEVFKIDADGYGPLDSGPDVGQTSLTRSGLVVSWIKGGASYSATLR